MKISLYFFLIFLVFACRNNSTQPGITNKSCPLPVQLTDPNTSPIGMHYAGKLSPDGTKLFFSLGLIGVKILDLKTLGVSQIDIRPLLPKNTQFGDLGPIFHWCPYDNSKFVCVPHLGVDTVGDGKKYPGGYHLAICSIDGSYYNDITPKILGPIGDQYGLDLRAWLPSSTINNSQFLIGYQIGFRGELNYGLYNPATQEFKVQDYQGLKDYTSDWKYCYYVNFDSTNNLRYYINNTELIFKDIDFASTSYASFSPDGKHFAIASNVYDKTKPYDSTSRLAEVWIVDVEEFMKNPIQPVPIKIINIKEKLCMFSFGLHPVFTSNNTIAVSMFKSGDNFEYLYEIDLNGNIKRQLTFVP